MDGAWTRNHRSNTHYKLTHYEDSFMVNKDDSMYAATGCLVGVLAGIGLWVIATIIGRIIINALGG